jgi:hypothetical protein
LRIAHCRILIGVIGQRKILIPCVKLLRSKS